MRVRRAVAVLTTAVLAAACSGGGGSGASARLTADGRTQLTPANRSPGAVDGTRTLHAGDRVKVETGTAEVRLSGGRRLELRSGTSLEVAADRGGDGLHPVLLGGDLLASSGSSPVSVTAGDSEVSVSGGAARLSRGLAVTVASYTATARIDSAGHGLSVPPLRQATAVAAGVLPGRPAALAYNAKDQWDQRFLGDAIDLGIQLVARSRGFTGQLAPDEGHTAGFYRQILPGLEREPSFDVAMLGADRSPGEALVGLAIALQSTRGTFDQRVAAVFGFHDDGAAWGLVALDQGVSRASLLAGIDEAIGRQPAVSQASAAPPTTAGGKLSRSPRPTTGPRAPTGSVRSGPVTVPPSATPLPPSGPLNTGLPLVDNTVKALVDLLSGLLGGGAKG